MRGAHFVELFRYKKMYLFSPTEWVLPLRRHPGGLSIGTIGLMPIVLPMALASSPKRGAGVAGIQRR